MSEKSKMEVDRLVGGRARKELKLKISLRKVENSATNQGMVADAMTENKNQGCDGGGKARDFNVEKWVGM